MHETRIDSVMFILDDEALQEKRIAVWNKHMPMNTETRATNDDVEARTEELNRAAKLNADTRR